MKFDLSNDMDISKARFHLDKLIDQKAKCEIKKVIKQRSSDQNSFLHVVLTIFSNHTGYSLEESKEVFASQLPELMYYEKDGYKFRKSTRDLDTKEMSALIEYIRNFCMDSLGIFIPTSEEYLINKFQIEKENGI